MWWSWSALVATLAAVMVADRWLVRRGRVVAAVVMSLVVAVAFSAVVAGSGGGGQVVGYLSAYGAERLLSVDNMVALLAVIAAFGLSGRDRVRALTWGVNAALVLRAAMVLGGVGLIESFWWSTPVLGVLLAAGGVHLARQNNSSDHQPGAADRVGARLARRGSSALMVAVTAVVVTDAVFALDSVPTVVAFASEPFPAVSAAVLSVLGLRPLGELIGAWVAQLRYLQPALGAVLVAVGIKLAVTPVWAVPDLAALGVVAAILAVGVAVSLLRPGSPPSETTHPEGDAGVSGP